ELLEDDVVGPAGEVCCERPVGDGGDGRRARREQQPRLEQLEEQLAPGRRLEVVRADAAPVAPAPDVRKRSQGAINGPGPLHTVRCPPSPTDHRPALALFPLRWRGARLLNYLLAPLR